MQNDHSISTHGFCVHALEPELLAHIAPVCAAARLELMSAAETPPRAAGTPTAQFLSLARAPEQVSDVPVFLVGLREQMSQLYERAAELEAHVVIVPDACGWLLTVLTDEVRGPKAQVAVVAASVGGAGASTVATLSAVRAAAQGHRVLLVDGNAYPTPQVGIGSWLTRHAVHDTGWDEFLELDELPTSQNLCENLSREDFVDGTLWWIAATQQRCVLPVAQVIALVRRYAHNFDQIVIDCAAPERAQRIPADRYCLVTPITDKADAACYFLEADTARWELVLNGPAGPGWTPTRFVETTTHPVLGRVKAMKLSGENLARKALRSSLAFLDMSVPGQLAEISVTTDRERARPAPKQVAPVSAQTPAPTRSGRERPWVPETPAQSLWQTLQTRLRVLS